MREDSNRMLSFEELMAEHDRAEAMLPPEQGNNLRHDVREMLLAPTPFEELCLREMDGELTAGEQETLEEICAGDPSLATLRTSLREAVVRPDTNVRFPHPERLYRRRPIIQPWLLRATSIAAAIVMLLLIPLKMGEDSVHVEKFPARPDLTAEALAATESTITSLPDVPRRNPQPRVSGRTIRLTTPPSKQFPAPPRTDWTQGAVRFLARTNLDALAQAYSLENQRLSYLPAVKFQPTNWDSVYLVELNQELQDAQFKLELAREAQRQEQKERIKFAKHIIGHLTGMELADL